MRYQLYREHKYVSAALNDLERLIARADFRDDKAVEDVSEQFETLVSMLKGHAQYEDERIHTLLEAKGSVLHNHAEGEHAQQEEQLAAIHNLIDNVRNATSDDDKVLAGYRLYLSYRKCVADNLAHLHEEETLLLPELQRLYSDTELQQIEAKTYRQMTPEQISEMLSVLFPHMNASDKEAMLKDVRDLAPEKFATAWDLIAPTLPETELDALSK